MEYTIQVNRGRTQGTLSYQGSISVSASCWWDVAKKIPAGEYKHCSKTTMTTKKNSKGGDREGIFIPDVPGFRGIFIHMGRNASWSDGCIVIREPKMLEIWKDIQPSDGRNVTVTVSDG